MNNNNDFENEKEIVDIEQENTEKTGEKKKSAGREFLEWLQAIVIAVVVAMLIKNFLFTIVKVSGESMVPTLNDSDRMVVWRLGYEPEQGDIIVFEYYNEDGELERWIKRVIATEGQKVEIDYSTNSVWVTGDDGKRVKLSEDYIAEPMYRPGDPEWKNPDGVEVVPEGCVFVMGDNRNHSKDGRAIGTISEDRIVGEAVLRFWPFNSIETY